MANTFVYKKKAKKLIPKKCIPSIELVPVYVLVLPNDKIKQRNNLPQDPQ